MEPETLLMRMQGYAVVVAAEVHLPLGADACETASFFACGMLGSTLTAIGPPASAGM
ncbi:hypothetical protein [Streptomyces sp. SD31]|uniref:hypothetical protein n=1 Tax=Streptomyces sp. SD31 TaxID=3452208 RepID=UPI003F8B83DA